MVTRCLLFPWLNKHRSGNGASALTHGGDYFPGGLLPKVSDASNPTEGEGVPNILPGGFPALTTPMWENNKELGRRRKIRAKLLKNHHQESTAPTLTLAWPWAGLGLALGSLKAQSPPSSDVVARACAWITASKRSDNVILKICNETYAAQSSTDCVTTHV